MSTASVQRAVERVVFHVKHDTGQPIAEWIESPGRSGASDDRSSSTISSERDTERDNRFT